MVFQESETVEHFEVMRSLEQALTFETAANEFSTRNVLLGAVQMKTLGLMNTNGIYPNLGMLLSDQCVHTIKAAVFEGNNQTHSTFGKLRRIDQRAFPETAIREALLNLLIHRLWQAFHNS